MTLWAIDCRVRKEYADPNAAAKLAKDHVGRDTSEV